MEVEVAFTGVPVTSLATGRDFVVDKAGARRGR
jgi:hypothetical protein